MWLLENQGDVFQGRRLWLRPGKLYLLGRTASEPGQVAISDKTVSRKHLTVQVDAVAEGDGRNPRSRSQITIEDLDTKKGTVLNGEQIRGQRRVLAREVNEIQLGLCAKLFRIVWHPLVFSFSFTNKELRNDPWTKLRRDLEQLDIKYSAEYERDLTSHVVSKKRNTSKGLQALIHGRYLVTDSFVDAVIRAATAAPDADADDDEADHLGASALERDFDAHWPDPLRHLPPRGEEPNDRPPAAYAPDARRRHVFTGYTFVFYDQKQYENLLPAVTSGSGKALFREVAPGGGDAQVDDLVRFVQGVAGERALDDDDGSGGSGGGGGGGGGGGVVVVRYLPAKGADFDWYAEFLRSVALRLDHRPIDQREFLDAILACDASMLRRPLQPEEEGESQAASQAVGRSQQQQEPQQATDAHAAGSATNATATEAPSGGPATAAQDAPSGSQLRRGRTRRGVASRFKGFDIGSDDVDTLGGAGDFGASGTPQSRVAAMASGTEDPSQQAAAEDAAGGRRWQRKRGRSPPPEEDDEDEDVDMMEDIAPTAMAAKRRRIEAGEEPVPVPAPEPQEDEDDEDPASADEDHKSKPPRSGAAARSRRKDGAGDGVDILELARRRRADEEARAAAEREAESRRPDDDIDYAALRALQIVEECEVHFPPARSSGQAAAAAAAAREQDVRDGRWDPRWNGRQNFKRFRKQGEPVGRPLPRVIIGLEEEKTKEYGIGDDYWLEDEPASRRRKKDSQSQGPTQRATTAAAAVSAAAKDKENMSPPPRAPVVVAVSSSSSSSGGDEQEEEDAGDVAMAESGANDGETQAPPPEPEPARTRAGRAAERANARRGQTQTQTQTQAQASRGQATTTTGGKRAAASAPATTTRAAKKAKKTVLVPDSDDSEDEPRFRFGRR